MSCALHRVREKLEDFPQKSEATPLTSQSP